MQLKNADRWAVVKEGVITRHVHTSFDAANIDACHSGACRVVHCRLVPVADLERLVEAANAVIVADAEDPLVDLTRALIASLEAAIAPFQPLPTLPEDQ